MKICLPSNASKLTETQRRNLLTACERHGIDCISLHDEKTAAPAAAIWGVTLGEDSNAYASKPKNGFVNAWVSAGSTEEKRRLYVQLKAVCAALWHQQPVIPELEGA